MKSRLFILFLIIVSSCSEDLDKSEITLQKISTEYKTYTLFESGSQWIYREETSGDTSKILIDSVVSYIGVNQSGLNNQIDFQYEAFEMFIDQDNNMGFRKYEIAATKEKKEASDMTSLLRLFLDNKYHTVFQPCFPFGDTVEIGTVSGNYINLGFYQNYSIGEHTFNEVYHTKVLDAFNPAGSETMELLFSPGVGIINFKRTTNQGSQNWNLIDWDTKQ